MAIIVTFPEEKNYVTITEAMRGLGVNRNTMFYYLRMGYLPFVKDRWGHVLIKAKSIAEVKNILRKNLKYRKKI